MHREEFEAWAASVKVPDETVEQLGDLIFSSSDQEQARAAGGPDLPLWSFEEIRSESEGFEYEFRPLEEGLILIGSGPSGDPIVVDITVRKGAVGYLSMSEIYSHPPPRDVIAWVSDDVQDFLRRWAESEDFPQDYYDALDCSDALDDDE